MRTSDINFEIKGQHKLVTEYAKIIPLIEKHFPLLHGQRALLASGERSAKFARTSEAFRTEVSEVSTARVMLDHRGGQSAWLQIDIHLPAGDGCGVCYFDLTAMVGSVDARGADCTEKQMFEYDFDGKRARQHVAEILATTPKMLTSAREGIAELNTHIENVKDAVPYAFRKCIVWER